MMTLYSGTTCPFSHRCRIVLFEKGMDFQIVDVDLFDKPEDLAVMNPYNQTPVLVERDLILYESNIINEYIDDRFPHPQLMPADPALKARARLFLFRFEDDLFSHIQSIESGTTRQAEQGRAQVRDSLIQVAPVFLRQKYMLGDEFSMLDVAIAPLLGLLGTVLGLIRAFHGISLGQPLENTEVVISGISEALVSTAIGLIVAIITLSFTNLFRSLKRKEKHELLLFATRLESQQLKLR